MVTGRGCTTSAVPCKGKKTKNKTPFGRRDPLSSVCCFCFIPPPFFFFFSKSGSKCTIVSFSVPIVQLNYVSVESVVSVQQASAAT